MGKSLKNKTLARQGAQWGFSSKQNKGDTCRPCSFLIQKGEGLTPPFACQDELAVVRYARRGVTARPREGILLGDSLAKFAAHG